MVIDEVEVWFKWKPTAKEYIKQFNIGAFVFVYAITMRNKKDDYKKPYHVELVYKDIAYSSNSKQGVRKCPVYEIGDKENFTIMKVKEVNIEYALKYFEGIEGNKYDTKGIILTQMFDFNSHSKNKEFCAEVVGGMLKVIDPHRLGIIDLKNFIIMRNEIINDKNERITKEI